MNQITIDQAMQFAVEHHLAGRLAEAEAIYREVLSKAPARPDALHLLGALACQAGHPDAAIDLIAQAIAIAPGVADYHNDLGEAYRRAGRLPEAIATLGRAIELSPGLAIAHSNLGNVLVSAGRGEEAIAAYQLAIALKGDDPQPYCNLGMSLQEAGRPEEAIAALAQAIALDPNLAEAHNNLGNALWDAGRLDEAVAALRRAIALGPHLAEPHNNLGSVLRDQGRHDEALAALRAAVTLRPEDTKAASNLLLTLHSHPDHDARAILAEHRRWARRLADPLAAQIQAHPNDRTPDRTLRVGYVSPDFRAHAVGQMLLGLFANHDRRQVEVIAYADVRRPDGLTRDLKARADQWNDTVRLSDAQLADRVRADRIDILVDLALHTPGNRMLVFARKPAPVQVTMLGLPATTGLTTIDYRLTDRFLDPPGVSDSAYSEGSYRLPHSFWVFPAPEEAPPVGPLPAERNGFVTFGCFNHLSKVTRPALELWRTILQALPDSRLVLLAPPGSHLDAIRAQFAEGGVAGERLAFVPRAGRIAYFRRYLDIDLALDPFPYNGHTSSLDALWMGVPVITLAGRTAVGRGGVSILSNLGLPELIADAPEHYAAIALDWARSPARLAALRGSLRQRMESSPLMDSQQFATDVEDAFRTMWKKWCGA